MATRLSRFFSFHVGLRVSLGGIFPCHGFQFGARDTLAEFNTYKNDTGILGLISGKTGVWVNRAFF